MKKLDMETRNLADEKFQKLLELFPNAVTETIEDGVVVRAVDSDVLAQEINRHVVDGIKERYQFTWPDKRKSMLLANSPVNLTLRPCREESVNFDETENLYIEGDNLDVLKMLRETYLGKVKMIYIDPPYNTGNDFVYVDDFAMSMDEYEDISGVFDEDGNRLFKNTESNGRFHTDWLNMMYPRLKVAKDLLTDDGVIFISIDDGEQDNLKKICDEIFGNNNFIANFIRKGSGGRQDSKHYAIVHEYVFCYSRNIEMFIAGKILIENDSYPFFDSKKNRHYKAQLLRKWGENSRRTDRPNLFYPIIDPDGNDNFPMLNSDEEGCWRWGKEKMSLEISKGNVEFKSRDGIWIAYEKIYEPKEGEFKTKLFNTIIDDISNNSGAKLLKSLLGNKVFGYPKPVDYISRIFSIGNLLNNDIILDFFSGSSTTAHAVMQLNTEDNGNRKFIMVQLPEKTEEDSEAYKAGYKYITEIGKERIRRAAKKIKEENPDSNFDGGFRVLKVDSSNMKDIFYNPSATSQTSLLDLESKIKDDRSAEDLLFQVMLDTGVLLSSKIEEFEIDGKKIFNVADNYMLACFDDNISEEVIKKIADMEPYFAVFKEGGNMDDSVKVNIQQIFKTYSPSTELKVL